MKTPARPFAELQQELYTGLQAIQKDPDPVTMSAAAIDLCYSALQQLRCQVAEHPFTDNALEIHFFKHIKPFFSSRFIYYNELYRFHTRRPAGSAQMIKEYIDKMLSCIEQFYRENNAFYEYYRTGHTHFDEIYFLRSSYNWQLSDDLQHAWHDTSFCTNYDHKLALLLAYDELQVYLQQPEVLGNMASKDKTGRKLPRWTDSTTAFVEVIYAFDTAGSFDHGKADVKSIIEIFSPCLDISAKDVYNIYRRFKFRKTERTPYLDHARDLLLKRLDREANE
jgi:hypothetical protein